MTTTYKGVYFSRFSHVDPTARVQVHGNEMGPFGLPTLTNDIEDTFNDALGAGSVYS